VALTFHFRAVATDGKARTGVMTADDERMVARELLKQGLTPVYVGRQTQSSGWQLSWGAKVSRKEVLYFTQELSTLLNAGIPVDRALQITVELTESTRFKAIVADVLRVLKGGKSLADALGTHPDAFSDLYVNMVRAGEASGSLAQIFTRLAEFERTRDDLRSFIVSSMIYPSLLLVVGLVSIVVLLTVVVPRFGAMFSDGTIPMPGPIQVMLAVSDALKTYGPWVLGAMGVGALLMRVYTRTQEGRLWWDSTALSLPLLGVSIRKAEVSRFAQAMGTLVASSVPLVQSLGIAKAILSNVRMANSLEPVIAGVKRGEGLASPMKRAGEFPPLASHLLSVGEETGRLDAMFQRMAEIYDEETRVAIKRFTTLFEPVVILVIGVVVGSLILSMMMAISSINEVAF
jgi:general secretion pathway protein F